MTGNSANQLRTKTNSNNNNSSNGARIKEQTMDKSDSMKSDKNRQPPAKDATTADERQSDSSSHGEQYWKMKYEELRKDFDHIQKVNQGLEDKLLTIVETFEKKREEMVAQVDSERNILMADVNKLSTKLVDARIRLHDMEEHAAECSAPCHKSGSISSSSIYPQPISTASSNNANQTRNSFDGCLNPQQAQHMANDPHLV